MAKVDTTFSFSIAERGETSGQTFNWSFTAKRMLSIRDRITRDGIRRQLIGDRAQDAERNTLMRAEMLALLQVSLLETPKTWQESGNGLDLFDDNIVMVVYEKVIEGQNKAIEEAEAAGEEAKEKLRKVAKSKKADEEVAKE
jgi:hypothetical protein